MSGYSTQYLIEGESVSERREYQRERSRGSRVGSDIV